MLRARPVMRSHAPMRLVPRRRRWARVSWWYSILLVIPLLFIGADWAFGWSPVSDDGGKSGALSLVTFNITDAASGQAIAGADVRAGDAAAVSNDQGIASLQLPNHEVVVTISHANYEPLYGNA